MPMATLSLSLPAASASATAPPTRAFFNCLRLTLPPSIRFVRRQTTVATRAIPAANSYILAFLLPLSLLGATVFASVRIADKLDADFLEDLELSQAIEAAGDDNEEDGDGEAAEKGGVAKPLEEETALPRTRNRNRPKRVAENSSV